MKKYVYRPPPAEDSDDNFQRGPIIPSNVRMMRQRERLEKSYYGQIPPTQKLKSVKDSSVISLKPSKKFDPSRFNFDAYREAFEERQRREQEARKRRKQRENWEAMKRELEEIKIKYGIKIEDDNDDPQPEAVVVPEAAAVPEGAAVPEPVAAPEPVPVYKTSKYKIEKRKVKRKGVVMKQKQQKSEKAEKRCPPKSDKSCPPKPVPHCLPRVVSKKNILRRK